LGISIERELSMNITLQTTTDTLAEKQGKSRTFIASISFLAAA